MKKLNDRKANQSSVKQHSKKNNPEISQMSIGLASGEYENTTGSDEDIAVDIQDTIGRDVTLSKEKITAGDIAKACAEYDKANNYLGITHNEKSKSTTRRLPW